MKNKEELGWVVGFKVNCPLVGLGPVGGVPYFLKVLARICARFGENHEKLQKARSTSATGY